MMLPKEIRQKSSELFPNDLEKQKIFCMGAAFSLGNDLSDFEITTEQKQEEYYPCKEALEMWLAYKKEKRQTYKPRGLEALKRNFYSYQAEIPNTQRLSLSILWATTIQGCSLLKIMA